MVRFIGALLVAIVAALVVFIWMSPGIHADQGLAAAAAQARGEAKKWQTNAALVQIELTGFVRQSALRHSRHDPRRAAATGDDSER